VGLAQKLLKVYLKFSETIDKLSDIKVGTTIQQEFEREKVKSDPLENPKQTGSFSMFSKGVQQEDILTKKLICICELIIKDVERHYEGSKYIQEIIRFQTTSNEDEEKAKTEESIQITFGSQKMDIIV
jgi:hypothetical protein